MCATFMDVPVQQSSKFFAKIKFHQKVLFWWTFQCCMGAQQETASDFLLQQKLQSIQHCFANGNCSDCAVSSNCSECLNELESAAKQEESAEPLESNDGVQVKRSLAKDNLNGILDAGAPAREQMLKEHGGQRKFWGTACLQPKCVSWHGCGVTLSSDGSHQVPSVSSSAKGELTHWSISKCGFTKWRQAGRALL